MLTAGYEWIGCKRWTRMSHIDVIAELADKISTEGFSFKAEHVHASINL